MVVGTDQGTPPADQGAFHSAYPPPQLAGHDAVPCKFELVTGKFRILEAFKEVPCLRNCVPQGFYMSFVIPISLYVHARVYTGSRFQTFLKIADLIQNLPRELLQLDAVESALVSPHLLVLHNQVGFLLKRRIYSLSLDGVLRFLSAGDDPFHAEKEMWDWPKVNLPILGMNGLRGRLARLVQAIPSSLQRVGGLFLSVLEEMKARSSLDDSYFVRLVRLFGIFGVVIVLSSVLSNPFGTLATIRHFAHTIDPVCG